MHRHQPKTNDIPPRQRLLLKLQKLLLAPRQYTPRITRRADRRLHERAEVPAAAEHGLNGEAAGGAELLGPLLVDLGLEVEGAALVGDVPRDDEQAEGDSEEEGVDGEEGRLFSNTPGYPIRLTNRANAAASVMRAASGVLATRRMRAFSSRERVEYERKQGVGGGGNVGDEQDDLEGRPAGFAASGSFELLVELQASSFMNGSKK
ncbi:hypothetical protein B0H16DRAFT_1738072 [Mycena metata]|uniref:Uncharacterized protein n=1 Tax=Mycena metata TaxID=1033252 RepID=A0AAD7HJM8_9AGAR|nr:hypothetical protein B0H16DRAFT_1738072 [Mycena metata]